MKNAFEVPAVSEPMSRHPKLPAPGLPIRLHHSHCYGCGDDAPIGLRLRVIAGEDFQVSAQMVVEQWMQGGPGMLHGGVLSAAFDEVMSTAPLLIGFPVVTGHLEIDFASPIPLGSTLHFTADVIAKQRRKVFVRASAHLGDPDQPVAAAHSILVTIDLAEHYPAYRDRA